MAAPALFTAYLNAPYTAGQCQCYLPAVKHSKHFSLLVQPKQYLHPEPHLNTFTMDGVTKLLGRGEPVEIVEYDKSGNVFRTWSHTLDNRVRGLYCYSKMLHR